MIDFDCAAATFGGAVVPLEKDKLKIRQFTLVPVTLQPSGRADASVFPFPRFLSC